MRYGLTMRTHHIVAVTILLLSARTWGAEPTDAPLTVEASVASVVEQIQAIPVEHALARVRFTSTALPSRVTTVGDSAYELLPSGLWGVTTLARINGGNSRERILSLCGLQELASTREGKVEANSTVVAPVGKVFLPLAIATTRDVSQTYRTFRLRLTPSLTAVCAPAEGSSFEYQTDSELVLRSQGGLVSSNRAFTLTHSWKCTAGRREQWDGVAGASATVVIPVTCEGTNSMASGTTTTRWFYIPGAALFLRLGTTNEKVSSTYEYQLLESVGK